MTPDDLIAFEVDIAAAFNAGHIRAPVHLSGGNEQDLIDIFRNVRPDDWVFSSWRSHYHALLKGIPTGAVKEAILAGHSMGLGFPEYRFLAGSIVGGMAPIAMGVAWAIKRRGGDERVWCFLGDMAAEGGAVEEAMKYADGHDLPIEWVIEDNGVSVGTNTKEVWGMKRSGKEPIRYSYKLTWPHVGTGKWISF